MIYSEETLMAFADGELDPETTAEIEAALKNDAHLAQRIASHRALRSDVFAAFAPILDEPVPQRLLDAAVKDKGKDELPASATLLSLDAARSARMPQAPRRWSWPEWGAIAATLIVGVMAGRSGLVGPQAGLPAVAQSTVSAEDGKLVAQGQLAQALSGQLASAQPADAAVRVGVSFRAKDGQYCRSFAMGGDKPGAVLSGLACAPGGKDSGRGWQIPVLVQHGGAQAGADNFRTAAVDIPVPVLQAIDERIAGKTLDADAERAALKQGWHP